MPASSFVLTEVTGGITSIIGPAGAGKSTLLISRLHSLKPGGVSVAGLDAGEGRFALRRR